MKRIERELQPELLDDDDLQRLLRIPGIGLLSALTIYLEVDRIERFPSDRQFFSYCRLVRGSSDSADHRRHRYSKNGHRYLKVVFTTAPIRTRSSPSRSHASSTMYCRAVESSTAHPTRSDSSSSRMRTAS
jgi:transposase